MLGILVTARRGTGNKIGNITVVQNEFMGHRHLSTLCGLGSFVLLIITPPLRKETEGLAKMWGKVARITQGLQQFPY